MSEKNLIRLMPWLVTIGLFVLWELLCIVTQVETFILPRPSLVFETMVKFAPQITHHSLQTLMTTTAGFALGVIGGGLLGIFIGASRLVYVGLYPVLVGFNSIPKVALVPVLVIWFGIGTVPAIITAFVISFFPIVVNVATGLATIEPEMEDVLKALSASKLDIKRKVGIPRALPYFFGSLKVAITLVFVGSVISESIASNHGIGNLMLQAQAQFKTPLIYAGLVALAVLGIAMYALMAWIEKRTTGWAHRSGFASG